MRLTFEAATTQDAEVIAELRNRVAADLTRRYGTGHRSSAGTARGVRAGSATPRASWWLMATGRCPLTYYERLAS